MDLTTTERITAAQLHKVIPCCRAVLDDGEAPDEQGSVRGCLGKGQRLSPGLGSRHYRDVFAQYLPADRERLAGTEPHESVPRPIMKRRAFGRSVDEHIGVDEAHRPFSS
jgi:hypothetical protein